MKEERWFACGDGKYVLKAAKGKLEVRKDGWLVTRKLGVVANLQDAFLLIKTNAGSENIKAL
jgi:hypothetical protein